MATVAQGGLVDCSAVLPGVTVVLLPTDGRLAALKLPPSALDRGALLACGMGDLLIVLRSCLEVVEGGEAPWKPPSPCHV